MITNTDLQQLAGKTMHGPDGQKIGKIVAVYESTDGPDGTFVTVSTGMFSGQSFVPLAKATMQGSDVVVPYGKDLVKDAPRVEADGELTAPEEERLYQHYSLLDAPAATPAPTAAVPPAAPASAAGRPAGEKAVSRGTGRTDIDGDGVFDDVQDTAVGRDTSGLTTDDAMTRSEERLRVGTETVEAGRARLRKRIVTEQVTATVPVTREQATVTREPITAANMPKAMDGPAISEEEHEVVLHQDVPVVAKEVVPVERVRLAKDTVTEQQTVSEQVRKEQIDTDLGDATPGDARR